MTSPSRKLRVGSHLALYPKDDPHAPGSIGTVTCIRMARPSDRRRRKRLTVYVFWSDEPEQPGYPGARYKYDMKDALQYVSICRHCMKYREDHAAKGQCLFSPTQFEV